jgi:hypothetical protein
VDVREFRASDGAAVRAFWQASGIRFIAGGEPPATPLAAFAERNPGLFLLALDERGLAATALADGTDGAAGCTTSRCVRISAGTDSVDDWSASSRTVCANADARR